MAWRSSFEGILAKNKTWPIQKIVRLSDVIFKSLWVMEFIYRNFLFDKHEKCIKINFTFKSCL